MWKLSSCMYWGTCFRGSGQTQGEVKMRVGDGSKTFAITKKLCNVNSISYVCDEEIARNDECAKIDLSRGKQGYEEDEETQV